MNIRLNDLFIFAAGAALGSVVTYKVVKDKYEQIIEGLEDRLNRRDITVGDVVYACANEGVELSVEMQEERNALDEMRAVYNGIAQNAGYTGDSPVVDTEVEKKREESVVPEPYIITPEEFEDGLDGYRQESLNYYACGTLTDDCDEIIDFRDDVIGSIDPAKHFGEHEADSVYVRNDVTKCDYEILRDTRTFEEAYPPIEG